jgi:signal peptidase I
MDPTNLRLRDAAPESRLSGRRGLVPAVARMQSESVQTGNFSWLRTIIIGRNPRLTAVRLVVVVVGVLLLRAYVLLPIQVDGPSMLPNYREHSINVVNRLAYLNREPQRGDVVAIRFSGTSIMLMKRVVGMPGETVQFVNGKLVINGRPMDEPYVKNECSWDFRPSHWQLGDDEYYVVGDNRAMHYEDHKQGSAKRERIVGKVML